MGLFIYYIKGGIGLPIVGNSEASATKVHWLPKILDVFPQIGNPEKFGNGRMICPKEVVTLRKQGHRLAYPVHHFFQAIDCSSNEPPSAFTISHGCNTIELFLIFFICESFLVLI